MLVASNFINTFTSSLNQAFCLKTAGSHGPFCERNSGAESGRELFKQSKARQAL